MFLTTERGWEEVMEENAALLRTKTVMVWRELISSASLVWERKVLYWE